MTESIWLSLLAPGGVIVVVVGGIFAVVQSRKARKRDEVTEVIREQVQNSHGTNLRDDIDKVMTVTATLESNVTTLDERLRDVERAQRSQHELILAEMRGMRRDIGRLGDADLQQAEERNQIRQKVDDLGDRYHELER